jgi:hypothetical protein
VYGRIARRRLLPDAGGGVTIAPVLQQAHASVEHGNVATNAVLKNLPPHDGPRIICGEGCRPGAARRKREGVVFKQMPCGIEAG